MSAQNAQAQVKLGPRLVVDFGEISDFYGGDFGIGADVRFNAGDLPVQFNTAFDYYFTDDSNILGQEVGVNVFTLDFNAVYMFGIENQVFTPYAGGGLGLAFVSPEDVQGVDTEGDTELGLNIVGGAEFPLESVTPFVQLQLTIGGDAERTGIQGGVLFNL
jgi:opacity protein-like surface antigen